MVAAARRRLVLMLLLISIGLVVFVRGWLFWNATQEPTLEDVFPTGEMVVGIDASFPPFAVDDGESLYGLDIDLANALGADMGVPVRFINMGYDGLYDALIDGHVDVVISALLVNPARMKEVHYTRPYFDNGLLLVTAPNSTITVMQDLPGYSLALEYGSHAHSQARFWLRRLPEFVVLPYELPSYALDAVRVGEADAALVDTTTYKLYEGEYPDWESSSSRVTNAFYAVAVRIDREDTWEWLDAAVGSLQYDDRLAEIIDRWF